MLEFINNLSSTIWKILIKTKYLKEKSVNEKTSSDIVLATIV